MTVEAVTRAIFLDFDGVLHPAGGEPGYALPFCWIPELAEELAIHEDVGLVIHSSWIEQFNIEDMREFLTPLGARLLGTVSRGPKAQAIQSFLPTRPEIRSWLVIDDQPAEFASNFPVSVLACDPRVGLSDPGARRRLREWLMNSKQGA